MRSTDPSQSDRDRRARFIDIVRTLEDFTFNRNGETKKKANYLYPAVLNSSFFINLIVISKYSSVIEPIAQMFQALRIDLSEVWKNVELLISILKQHRENSENEFSIIWHEGLEIATKLNIELFILGSGPPEKYF